MFELVLSALFLLTAILVILAMLSGIVFFWKELMREIKK